MPGVETARFVGPAERLGAGERGHAQKGGAGHIGMEAVEEADFGQYVEVGVGSEAVGADGDADAAGQELPKRMRRMAEGGVGAGAVDDAGVGWDRGGRVEVVAVNDQGRRQAVEKAQDMVSVFRQPFRIPDAEFLEQEDERPAPEDEQFLFRRCLREVDGDGHAAGGGGEEQRGTDAVRSMWANAGAAGRRGDSGGEPAVEAFVGAGGAVLRQPQEFAEDHRPYRRVGERVPAAAVAGNVAEQRRAEAQTFGQTRPDVGLHLLRRAGPPMSDYFS